jgi:hypothetical protein
MEITDPALLKETFRAMDAEHTLLWSSDWPHWDFDLPGRLFGPSLPQRPGPAQHPRRNRAQGVQSLMDATSMSRVHEHTMGHWIGFESVPSAIASVQRGTKWAAGAPTRSVAPLDAESGPMPRPRSSLILRAPSAET